MHLVVARESGRKDVGDFKSRVTPSERVTLDLLAPTTTVMSNFLSVGRTHMHYISIDRARQDLPNPIFRFLIDLVVVEKIEYKGLVPRSLG
jgi:hypothetical protein